MIIIVLFFKILFVTQQPFVLEEGDLIFQDLDCGPFCDAIEKVTFGYDGANLSHVGMVIGSESDGFQIIEATTKGVVLTPLDVFLSKSLDEKGRPKVIVGRVKEDYRSVIATAKQNALSFLGKEYDDVFDISNDTYYCSELIYESFKNENNESLFKLFPMTFIDPDTEKTFGIWIDYYEKLDAVIPEGELGLNPGGISRSETLDIVYNYKVGR